MIFCTVLQRLFAHAHKQDVKTSKGTGCSYHKNTHAHCRVREHDRGHNCTCPVDSGSALEMLSQEIRFMASTDMTAMPLAVLT